MCFLSAIVCNNNTAVWPLLVALTFQQRSILHGLGPSRPWVSLHPSGLNKPLWDTMRDTKKVSWQEHSVVMETRCVMYFSLLLRRSAAGCTFPEREERFVFVSEVRLPSNIQRCLTGTLWLFHFFSLFYCVVSPGTRCFLKNESLGLSFSCPLDSPTTELDWTLPGFWFTVRSQE